MFDYVTDDIGDVLRRCSTGHYVHPTKFHRDKSVPDGLAYYCKRCLLDKNTAYKK